MRRRPAWSKMIAYAALVKLKTKYFHRYGCRKKETFGQDESRQKNNPSIGKSGQHTLRGTGCTIYFELTTVFRADLVLTLNKIVVTHMYSWTYFVKAGLHGDTLCIRAFILNCHRFIALMFKATDIIKIEETGSYVILAFLNLIRICLQLVHQNLEQLIQ